MPTEHASAELLRALSRLHGDVAKASLQLETPGAAAAREQRAALIDQLADYVLPRLVQLDAPLLVVVGGSTGAGKSTLVNSIVGERLTESGVLRPTTRSPVLVHHPDDAAWFQPERILPELPRTDVPTNDTYAIRLASTRRVPPGLAILDAPDVDSIDEGNRELAAQLLAAADLWLFVTSAARYADQVPWDYLRSAAERSTSVAVVLDRTSAEAVIEVRAHLARMMTARGLSDSPLFTVPESAPDVDGLLPKETVADIVGWLFDLAADPVARERIVSHTLDGAIRQDVFDAHDIADAMVEQIEAAERLAAAVGGAYESSVGRFAREITDGSMLRGEVVARWQDFVGTGDLVRSVEEKVGRIRDRLIDGVTGKRTRSTEVTEAIEAALHMALIENAEAAAQAASTAWLDEPAGRALLVQASPLDHASRDLRTRAERIVRDWQQMVLDLVRDEGADKRMTGKFLALGVNGIGVALMMTVFADDAEPAVRSSSDVGRTLLEAIFGQAQVDDMTRRVRDDLVDRVVQVFALEQQRYLDLFDSGAALRDNQEQLREAARQAEYARHTDFLEGDA